jgi:hypothetical protein
MAISCRSIKRGRPVPALLLLLLLPLCGCASAPPLPLPAPSLSTGVVGQVLDRAALPAAGAHVYAYRSARSGLRGPADFEATVAAEGHYALDLAAGDYYLVARARGDGGDSGPMRGGDGWAVHADNPVRLREGELLHIDFRLQEVVRSRQLRDGDLAAGKTGFSGTLVDAEGRIVAGAFVQAYRPGEGRRRPDYSTAADENGRFVLYTPSAGTFCLVARSQLRGQPRSGELSGRLGAEELGCPVVSNGELLEVGAIVLRPHPP